MDLFTRKPGADDDDGLCSMNYKLLDRIRLKRDIPERNLKKGMTGTIVIVHEKPNTAYEVEFYDDQGGTIAQLALQPNEIELLYPD